MLLPRQQVREVLCEGDPFELGRAQGAALRENIYEALHAVGELEAFRLRKPGGLPFPIFRRMAETRAAGFLRRALQNTPLSTLERLRGISQGASVPLRKLALCSMLEAVLSDLSQGVTSGPSGLNAGCSAVAVTGSASETGQPLIAHNFDYVPAVQPFYFVRRCHPTGKLRSLEFSLSPLAGAVDGINEAGLAIACNYAYVTDRMAPAPTITMLIAEMLANYRTVDDAAGFVASTPRVGGGLLMMADATGTIASVEVSNSRVTRRDPRTDHLFHTNRLHTEPMAEVELRPDTHYGAKSPMALRGRRVHESADRRIAAIESRLENVAALSPNDLHAIMSDHGESASGDSVCMHGDYWHTTACLQLIPANSLLRASFTTACTADFRDFALDPTPQSVDEAPQEFHGQSSASQSASSTNRH